MSTHRTLSRTLALAAGLAAFAAAGVSAQTQPSPSGQVDHPRRAEVNERLREQGHEIHREVKSGAMSKDEARQLHVEDHAIHREEHALVKANGGGDLTAAQQQKLNQREDQVAKRLKK